MKRCWSAWACSAAVVCGAGCAGGHAAQPPVAAAVWRANARQVVEQLRVDIAAAAVGGTNRASARRALADVSDLYALLEAYSDLGGCRVMVAASGAPARVTAVFRPACAHLERAAALFSRAAQHGEPAALVRATRETAAAQPSLVRAMLAVR
jgi:hypothetical protein